MSIGAIRGGAGVDLSVTYGQIPISGTLAARPATPTKGQQYLATDTASGTLYEALTAGVWTQVAAGVSAGGAVSSVNTRTGAVTGLAEASDLTAEISRATAAEGSNTTAIASEATTARAAEALKLAKASNLSDLASAATARTNLGAGAASGLATLGTDGVLASAQRPATLSALINAFTRTRYYSNEQTGSNALGGMYRTRHRALTAGYGAILRYGNTGGTASLAEGSLGNNITVKASVEDASGNIYPVHFRGARSVTLEPAGGVIDSDPVGIEWVAGAVFFVRTLVTVASTTQKWPQSTILLRQSLGEGIELGSTVATPTDKTDSGTITAVANDTTYAYGPLAIRSSQPVANPVVLGILGDSIEQGTGDQSGPGAAGDLGYVERALYRVGGPAIDVARFGEQLFGITAPLRYQRFKLLGGATHVLCQLGINDLTGGAALAQMQARALVIATALQTRSVAAYFTTITPKTTSTDEWRTTTNQTLSLSNEAARTGYNDWLRGGAPIDPTTLAAVAVGTGGALLAGSALHPMRGYFEAADTVESARNSGKWIAFSTGDGLHPNVLGHKALAAAVDTTIFGFSAQPAVPAFPSSGVIAGLKFRYNFGAINAADGSTITAVTDLGPNGWNLAVAGAGGNVVFKKDYWRGNPGAQFSNGKTLDNASVTVAQPNTIVAVCMIDNLTGAGEPFDGITTRQRLNVGSSATGSNADIYAGSILGALPYPYNPTMAPMAFTCVFNGSSSHGDCNGLPDTPGAGGANSLVGLRVGSALLGGMMELFAWDHDVVAVPAELAALNAYLAYAYDLRFTGQPQVY